jgi:hypothetical protein
MDLSLAVICEEARERPDGKLDLIGIYNELSAPGFPAMQERMTVAFVLEWRADETGRQDFRADLVDERDARILTIEGYTEVAPRSAPAVRAQTRLIMPLQQVVFPHAGHYRFDLVAAGDVWPACSIYVGLLAPG